MDQSVQRPNIERFDRLRVLVTGGAGFIGSHLVEGLVARGARVSVADDLSTGHQGNLAAVTDDADFHALDLAKDDLSSLLVAGRFELVFHLAANGYVPPSVEDPRFDLERNVLATFNLLEGLRELLPDAHLVNASSAAVYGEGVRMPMHEDDATFPLSPYGVSKLAAERYVAVYAHVYGLRTTSVRLFPVYGPRLRKQVIYDLMSKIEANPDELFIHGDGTQVRDFNHVTNVVHALLRIAQFGRRQGDVYNVASGERVAIGDLARMICTRMGVSPRFVYSGSVRPGEAQSWRADISLLESLGYRSQLGLSDGLSETVAWFMREMALA
jgi:UDP-glucose 4-epimerase